MIKQKFTATNTVQKADPTKQGLKHCEVYTVSFLLLCPKGRSNKTRIETLF